MSALPYVSVIARASAGRRDLERMAHSVLQSRIPFEWELLITGLLSGGKAHDHLQNCFRDDLATGRLKLICTDKATPPSAAWNQGAQKSQGSWLFFAEARDEWQSDRLARFIEAFSGNTLVLESDHHLETEPSDWIHWLARETPKLMGGAIKAELFQELGGFRELGIASLSENEFWSRAVIRLVLEGSKQRFTHRTRMDWTRHPSPVLPHPHKKLELLRAQVFRGLMLKNLPMKYWPLLAKSVVR